LSGEAADAVDYRDFRLEYDTARLDGFVRLYDEAFTDPAERDRSGGALQTRTERPRGGAPYINGGDSITCG